MDLKSNMQRIIILMGTFVSTVAVAEVPNTFQAGAPATANAVNENFQDLDTKIEGLSSTVAEIEGNINSLTSTYDLNGYYAPNLTKSTFDYRRFDSNSGTWRNQVFENEILSNGDEIETYVGNDDVNSWNDSYTYGYTSGQYSHTLTSVSQDNSVTETCSATGTYAEDRLFESDKSAVTIGGSLFYAYRETYALTETCSVNGDPNPPTNDSWMGYYHVTDTFMGPTTFFENGFQEDDCILFTRARSQTIDKEFYTRCRGIGTVKRERIYENGSYRIETITDFSVVIP